MKRGFYITIVKTKKIPFEAGVIVKLSKDRGNGSSICAIRATLPLLGTVGYVALSSSGAAGGTLGAEKIYNKTGKSAYAQIMFVTEEAVIAKVLSPKEVIRTPYLRAYRRKGKKHGKINSSHKAAV